MNRCRLLCLLACALLAPVAVAIDPVLQPQRAVLVLRNRQVLEGDVTPAGDYYLVALGKTGQLRLPARDVEMICRDLDEAYHRKADDIEGKSAAAHLDLADWCLKQSLHEHARREIAVAQRLDALHPNISLLERRLEFATAPVKPVSKPPPTTATVSAQQLERTMKELPPGAVEHFTAIVQPILMDRCGAVSCHGRDARTQFELLQPVAGKIPSKRFTRNLFATLSAVDKELPEQSLLLIMARKPHGITESAAFKSDDDRQFRVISQWVHSLRRIPEQPQPATVNAALLGMPRPQISLSGSGATLAAEPATQPTASPSETPPAAPTSSRDPFDPEIFNRRFHSKK
jgi:hypothetical protein